MLKKRIVLCLTFDDGVLFRTKRFCPDLRYTRNFVDLDVADEIVLLDITRAGPSADFRAALEPFVNNIFLPLSIGGHVRALDDVRRLLRWGADKVVICSQALREPEFITSVARLVGSQSCVISIDVKDDRVYANHGTTRTKWTPVKWAKRVEKLGAGEILLQDIDRDGSLQGYNLELVEEVAGAVSIPVVAATGCGLAAHMEKAFEVGADACSTACIFHFSRNNILGFKQWLMERGQPMRPTA